MRIPFWIEFGIAALRRQARARTARCLGRRRRQRSRLRGPRQGRSRLTDATPQVFDQHGRQGSPELSRKQLSGFQKDLEASEKARLGCDGEARPGDDDRPTSSRASLRASRCRPAVTPATPPVDLRTAAGLSGDLLALGELAEPHLRRSRQTAADQQARRSTTRRSSPARICSSPSRGSGTRRARATRCSTRRRGRCST